MHEVRELIQQHGDLFYLIVFAWTALEGETFVLFAGFFAQKGIVNVWLLFVAAWMGSMVGDQACFMIGRKFGPYILKRLPKLKPGIDRALNWLQRYAVAFILCYRFMYGLRNVSGVAVGLSHLEWKRFTFWNGVASFVWAIAFVGFGYAFGSVAGHMGGHKQEVVEASVHEVMLSVLGLFAVIIIIKLVMIRVHKRKLHKK